MQWIAYALVSVALWGGWAFFGKLSLRHASWVQVSFTYGSGFPALWRHENLNPETHEWLRDEFAHVPITFFEQMRKCVAAGRLLAVEYHDELPRDFVAQPPRTDARFGRLVLVCSKELARENRPLGARRDILDSTFMGEWCEHEHDCRSHCA